MPVATRVTTLSAMRRAAGDRLLLGTILISGGPEWVELCGTVALDYVIIDQMITSIDWAQTANMLRAAEAYGTSGWVRLPAYPWGGERQGAVLQRDILRAFGIGAQAIVASVEHPEDLAEMLALRSETSHRKNWDGAGYFTPPSKRRLPSIIPLIESKTAVDNLASFVQVDGIEAVWLGLGDLSWIFGAASQNDIFDPVLSDLVARAVEICRPRGVTVMTNVGFRETPAEVARSARKLTDLGVGMGTIIYPDYMMFRFYREVMRLTRPDFESLPVRSEAYRQGWTEDQEQ